MKAAMFAGFLVTLLIYGCGGGGAQTTGVASPSNEQAPESAEASIEGFGTEAEGTDRAELLAAFHGYLEALAHGDTRTACTYLSSRVKASLAELVEGQKPPPCAEPLHTLLSSAAPEVIGKMAKGEIKKIRVKKDLAFVVFHAPGARLYQLNLNREQGDWRVALVSPSILAPAIEPTE
jgi:hypothetical protein